MLWLHYVNMWCYFATFSADFSYFLLKKAATRSSRVSPLANSETANCPGRAPAGSSSLVDTWKKRLLIVIVHNSLVGYLRIILAKFLALADRS